MSALQFNHCMWLAVADAAGKVFDHAAYLAQDVAGKGDVIAFGEAGGHGLPSSTV
ncbi:hypothetical protein UNDYM_1628 [Undibacterium sp. YM2]|uniref:hypothetical protein n=1 Tax=Undibacterium sp. YM2 TaxID=2058625 RepID=UPI001331DB27|nr:hypothetical protein [Undibacterium sp. YM2]BBB65881.1 hypothetical protein UNDYM_1628 [Undibacterium sp. YM2]